MDSEWLRCLSVESRRQGEGLDLGDNSGTHSATGHLGELKLCGEI